MLKKQFLEITAAVKELKEKAAFHSLQLDGWTSPTKEFIFQAISVVNGTPFFETQPTSQGDKCDAAWMIKTVEPLLKDPKCAGLTCDNCSVMQDFKSAFQEFASKLNRVVFYANCQWHGADSIGAALIGEGGVATAAPLGLSRGVGRVGLRHPTHPLTEALRQGPGRRQQACAALLCIHRNANLLHACWWVVAAWTKEQRRAPTGLAVLRIRRIPSDTPQARDPCNNP